MAGITPDYTSAFTTAATVYMNSFKSYSDQLMHWGKEIFSVLLAINITWAAIWYAFDKDSMVSSMSSFLKKFTVAIIFYSIMVNPSFLTSLIVTTTDMGKTITGYPMDPSSIISTGFSLGNKIIHQISTSSFLTATVGAFEALLVYVVIVFCFMSVALQISVAQLISTALAMLACFSLSFSALSASSKIAHKTIDALIGNCFKLLAYYIVVGSSLKVFDSIANLMPDGFKDMTPYGWMCASALLMWLLSKNLAGVFERIGGGITGETEGADTAAIALSALNTSRQVAFALASVAQNSLTTGKTLKNATMAAAKAVFDFGVKGFSQVIGRNEARSTPSNGEAAAHSGVSHSSSAKPHDASKNEKPHSCPGSHEKNK